jgi:hypothetical protein
MAGERRATSSRVSSRDGRCDRPSSKEGVARRVRPTVVGTLSTGSAVSERRALICSGKAEPHLCVTRPWRLLGWKASKSRLASSARLSCS